MDPFAGNGLQGIAQLVIEKWFAAMGLVGLLLFAAALVVDLPMDRSIVISIALIMFGYGFGHAECRRHRQEIVGRYTVTRPIWRWTVSGIMLFAIATGAAVMLAITLIFG